VTVVNQMDQQVDYEILEIDRNLATVQIRLKFTDTKKISNK